MARTSAEANKAERDAAMLQRKRLLVLPPRLRPKRPPPLLLPSLHVKLLLPRMLLLLRLLPPLMPPLRKSC